MSGGVKRKETRSRLRGKRPWENGLHGKRLQGKTVLAVSTLGLLALSGCAKSGGQQAGAAWQEASQNGAKQQEARQDAAGQQEARHDGTAQTGQAELSDEQLVANDFLLYFVNCGFDGDGDTGQKGLWQSVPDQPYAQDTESGMRWGYHPVEGMAAVKDETQQAPLNFRWEIAQELKDYDPQTTGFLYSFEVPDGTYSVTCGFYNPFSARTVTVDAEGSTAVQQNKILKFQDKPVSFEQEVTDGGLDLKIYNPQRGSDAMKNPIVTYIAVRKVPEYDRGLLEILLGQTAVTDERAQELTEGTLAAYEEAAESVREYLLRTEEDGAQCEVLYRTLWTAWQALEEKPVYSSFRPGESWLDTEGNPIQAHGGQVQLLTVKDEATGEWREKWWWVGEDKTSGYRGGVCAYSSDDLYNWRFEGIILRNVQSREQLEQDSYFKELYGDYSQEQLDQVYRCINDTSSVIERPKLIYNDKTKQYVLWFHADGPTQDNGSDYAAACAGVAVSDSPAGPFRFIDRYRLNICPADQEDQHPQDKGMARDMNLFQDEDGTAYIIYSSEENLTIYIAKLNDTYDALAAKPEEAVYGEDFIRLYPGAQREAPAMFFKDGMYYLMTSGATGWNPNRARCWRAKSVLGEWEDLGDPCIGDDSATTFASQSTCVFRTKDGGYIYMGDRWNSDELSDSRYVWLPAEFDADGKLQLRWQEEWRLEQTGE